MSTGARYGIKAFGLQWTSLFVFIALAHAPAWGAAGPGSLAELTAAAKTEGVLNVTWAGAMGGADSVTPLQEAFNRKYGLNIKLNYTPGPSMPQLAQRFIQEAKAGRKASFDFFVGSDAYPAMTVQADVAEMVPWSALFPHVKPEMLEFGGKIVRVSTGFRGVFYNTKMVKPNQVPAKTADVFRPEWKGKIASTPYGAQFEWLVQMRGVEETRALVRKTAEWAGGLIRCPEEERVVSGEFILLFFACNDAKTQLLNAQGAPIDYAMMEDALMMGFNYIMIPRNSEHPNLAKLFTAFSVSAEGQAILDRFGYGLHLIPGTAKHKRYQSFAQRGLKFYENTSEESLEKAAQMEKLREEFTQILSKK